MSSELYQSDADSGSMSDTGHVRQRKNRPKKKRKRPERPQPNYDDILVRGYGSTIFRNDDLAYILEKGDMLVRWQDDESLDLSIDRYDVRNLLDNENQFHGGGLALESDGHEEECDAERYADIDSEEEKVFNMSDDEKAVYLYEKAKRQKMELHDERFAYANDHTASHGEDQGEEKKHIFKLKYPAPDGVSPPSTERLAQIIEKTATFIKDSNNPQMEIIIQTKQAGNADFSFLNNSDPCHPYFKHVLMLLRTGLFAYGGSDEESDEAEEEENTETGEEASAEAEGAVPASVDPPTEEERKGIAETLDTINDSGLEVDGIPASMKDRIEKTANFVGRNGPAFETKLREKNIGDPKFAFLNPWNRYHAHYRVKVMEVEAGLGQSVNGGLAGMAGTTHHEDAGQGVGHDAASVDVHPSMTHGAAHNAETAAPNPEVTVPSVSKFERLQKAKEFLTSLRARQTTSAGNERKASVDSNGRPEETKVSPSSTAHALASVPKAELGSNDCVSRRDDPKRRDSETRGDEKRLDKRDHTRGRDEQRRRSRRSPSTFPSPSCSRSRSRERDHKHKRRRSSSTSRSKSRSRSRTRKEKHRRRRSRIRSRSRSRSRKDTHKRQRSSSRDRSRSRREKYKRKHHRKHSRDTSRDTRHWRKGYHSEEEGDGWRSSHGRKAGYGTKFRTMLTLLTLFMMVVVPVSADTHKIFVSDDVIRDAPADHLAGDLLEVVCGDSNCPILIAPYTSLYPEYIKPKPQTKYRKLDDDAYTDSVRFYQLGSWSGRFEVRVCWPATHPTTFEIIVVKDADGRPFIRLEATHAGVSHNRTLNSDPPLVPYAFVAEQLILQVIPISALPVVGTILCVLFLGWFFVVPWALRVIENAADGEKDKRS